MKKTRTEMSVADRAKQFMPFAAVSGLDEALERKLADWKLTHEREEFREENCEEND